MVSIYDVASAAGVSASTVSRTLHRPDKVSAATAKKVMDAVDALGYRKVASTPPKSTPLPGTGMLGMVVADSKNPFFVEMFRGADDAARASGYQLVVAHGSEDRCVSVVEALVPHVDGVLLASPRVAPGTLRMIARSRHTVVLNRSMPDLSHVMIDNTAAAADVVEYLIQHGVRSIAYIGGPASAYADGARWQGIMRGAHLGRQRAHTIAVRRVRTASPTIVEGYRAVKEWRAAPTDAVVCFNELIAVGFMHGVCEAGFDVPEQVKVIGFDDTDLAQIVSPQLTTVAAPLRLLGSTAAAILMRQIQVGAGHKPVSKILPSRLIVRESA